MVVDEANRPEPIVRPGFDVVYVPEQRSAVVEAQPTLPRRISALGSESPDGAPPAPKAVELPESLGILRETTGKQPDRMDAYREYIDTLSGEEAWQRAGTSLPILRTGIDRRWFSRRRFH